MQRGTVLIVTLLVLLLLALLAAAVGRSNLMQLQMAGNDEAKMSALQHALAIQDAVLAQQDSTPVLGGVGYRICTTGSTNASCDQSTLAIDTALQPAIGRVDAVVTRVGPALARLPVLSEAMASSGLHYRVAKFEIRSTYDGSAEGLARAETVQGVLVRLVAPAQ
jgi:type II secretory pathway pseudopilin PulG